MLVDRLTKPILVQGDAHGVKVYELLNYGGFWMNNSPGLFVTFTAFMRIYICISLPVCNYSSVYAS